MKKIEGVATPMSMNADTGLTRTFSVRTRHEEYARWREAARLSGEKNFNQWACAVLSKAARELEKDVDQAVKDGIREFNCYLSDPILINPQPKYRFIPAPPSRWKRFLARLWS